jgi:hypothetical protein
MNPRRVAIEIKYKISLDDPKAISRNRSESPCDSRAQPSTIFVGTEIAGAPKLALNAEAFGRREVDGQPIDCHCQLIGKLKGIEFPVVPWHERQESSRDANLLPPRYVRKSVNRAGARIA